MEPEIQDDIKNLAKAINVENIIKLQLEDAKEKQKILEGILKDSPYFLSANGIEPLRAYIKGLDESLGYALSRKFEIEANLRRKWPETRPGF